VVLEASEADPLEGDGAEPAVVEDAACNRQGVEGQARKVDISEDSAHDEDVGQMAGFDFG
jgi:hypothetical protein